MAQGLEKSGFETILLVENDKDCVATLRKNRPLWNVQDDDIKDIDFRSIKADLVTGGFPCQAFSHAGNRLGFDDTRGTLFYEFARAVREIKPKIFLAENVEAIIRNNDGRTIRTILDVLSSLGYSVEYKVLNALNYHVPQKRKRVMFVGTKKGTKFQFPKPSGDIVTLRHALHNVPKSAGEKFSERRKEMTVGWPGNTGTRPLGSLSGHGPTGPGGSGSGIGPGSGFGSGMGAGAGP